MINISDELKNIYKNDQFPFTDSVTSKDLVIYFPDLDLTIETDQIVDDSFELDENLCSTDDLEFGACEAAMIKFTVADVDQDLKGYWFIINQLVDGYDPVPLGMFKVENCVKQDDLRFKDITAYNVLKYTDVNVADWYNSLFPTGNETYTLKQFRQLLLTYLGIEYEDENLPNDDITVSKTIEPTSISGREVLRRCVELQGGFGQINRYGKFYHKILQPAYGLYPTENLYPDADLYPVAEDDTAYVNETLVDETIPRHEGIYFEEYTVKEIDKLIIRSEEDDVGAIYGTGSNAYIIQGNFLVYGKSAAELQQIARNAFGNMAKRPYRPYEGKSTGLSYIVPGDTVQYDNYGSPVTGYVLQRRLTGIQALTDEFTAKGNEEREQNFGVNEEIIQTQGKLTRIKKDVEGVRVEVEDLAEKTATKIEQTATAIALEASRAIGKEEELSGKIEVLAGQVILKVDASGNVAAVELGADPTEGTSIKLKASNISLEGLVTANGYFKILEDGSMKCVNGEFSGKMTSSSSDGSYTMTINYGNLKFNSNSDSSGLTVNVKNIGWSLESSIPVIIYPTYAQIPTLKCQNIEATGGTSISVNSPMNCASLSVGRYSVIHAGNIASQSVAYAQSAYYSSTAGSVPGLKTNQITAVDTGYGNLDFLGFDNAAGVNWVQANFQSKTSSDIRLKYDIQSINDLPDDIFFNLKPKKFKYKTKTDNKIYFGLIAQEVEKAFASYGLDPQVYDLFDIADVKQYTDDGYYVKDKTHRLNYINLIPWMIKIIQDQHTIIKKQDDKLRSLEDKILQLLQN